MGQSNSSVSGTHSSLAPPCGTSSDTANLHATQSSTDPPQSSIPNPLSIADSAGSQLKENLEYLHHQLMQHAGADFDIVTTTTLSYSQFLTYISKLNEICRLYQDDESRVLVFAVKKGTDSSIFWKATVRIACVKYHTKSETTESYRLLNIRQFLQVFRRISYECTDGSLGAPPSPSRATAGTQRPMVPTAAASVVLGEMTTSSGESGEASGSGLPSTSDSDIKKTSTSAELEECLICLERKTEVILPCAHAYCLPCIQQWWEYTADEPHHEVQCTRHMLSDMPVTEMEERTCPVCRECVSDDDDTWVISEAPDDAQVTHEISKTLMGLADSGGSKGRQGHLSTRRLQQ